MLLFNKKCVFLKQVFMLTVLILFKIFFLECEDTQGLFQTHCDALGLKLVSELLILN